MKTAHLVQERLAALDISIQNACEEIRELSSKQQELLARRAVASIQRDALKEWLEERERSGREDEE